MKIPREIWNSILSDLLQGKAPKNVATDHDVNRATVSEVLADFPLFFGLRREYKQSDD